MHNERKIPELRFDGFTDTWEQRKLDELCDLYSGLTYSPADVIESGGSFVLRSSNVKDGEVVDADNVYVKSAVVNCNNVAVGDVVVVVRNGSRSLIGKHGQIKRPMTNTVVGAFMTGLRPAQPEFANALLDTPRFDFEIAQNLGATINQITNGMFRQMSFVVPSDEKEQISLGSFFRNLDDTITLKKQQYEQTVNIKKAMLEKMFPKKGARVPEIRFDGFTDTWEQRRLGECVTIYSGWSPSGFDEPGDNLFIKVDDLNNSTRTQVDSKMKVKVHSKYQKIKSSSIIFPKRGAAIMTNKVRLLGFDSYMDTNMMALEPGDINHEFLYIYLEMTGLYKIADTSTLPQINNKHIEPYEVLVPTIDEQIQIGTFFTNLDNLITLHQRELEKLQNIKNACLSKMFV